MPTLWSIIGYSGHGIAAVLFAALAILTSRRAHAAGSVSNRVPGMHLLVVALALSALWSLRQALGGVLGTGGTGGAVAETLRNGAWLALISVLASQPGRIDKRERPVSHAHRAVTIVLALLLLLQIALDIAVGEGAQINHLTLPLFQLSWIFRCIFALGALALLHDLFITPAQDSRVRLSGWIGAGLTFMWAYDCNHYGIALLWGEDLPVIAPMRGFAMALLASLIAVGILQSEQRRFHLSRAALQRIGGVLFGGACLLAMMLLLALARIAQEPVARLVLIAALFALSVVALAIFPSSGFRSWLRVEISKHLFAHRYDYRVEWRRFTEAVSEREGRAISLGERIARGTAQIIGAPAGLTLLRTPDGALAPGGGWQWREGDEQPFRMEPALCRDIEVDGWIVDFGVNDDPVRKRLPAAMLEDSGLWALVPAIHNGHLVGAMLLARPVGVARRLDWEDLDMMRIVGGQAAATISDALVRDALAEAQRFDDFNRRFAFILHDIKNQVSQMSLLASNAERHAENPEFRADMVVALRETATRMTDMLQKLSRPGGGEGSGNGRLRLDSLLPCWVRGWSMGDGSVQLSIDDDACTTIVMAHADGLERAIGQLVRNGIEANDGSEPVLVRLRRSGGMACVEISDKGVGMSADFIRTSLFRPFTSTKSNGFGLGAQEAKSLIEAMNGTIKVRSVPDEGTSFEVRLPLAAAHIADTPIENYAAIVQRRIA